MTDVPRHTKLASVVLDQTEGVRLATRHLLELGHRHIAEISGPLNWYSAAERHEAWLRTVQRAGLVTGPSHAGDWTARGGYGAAQQPLGGAVRALREHDLSVPEDVSVVSFDDIPEASFFEPPLTTVRQDFGAMGQQAVDYLVTLIQQPGTPQHQRVLYPQLITRLSTAQSHF